MGKNLCKRLKISCPPWESLYHRVDAMEESNAAVFIHKVAGVYMNRGEGGRGGGQGGGGGGGDGGGGGQGGGKEREKDLSEHFLFSFFFHIG